MKAKIFFITLILFVFSWQAYAGNMDRPLTHFQTSVTVTNSASYILTENLKGRTIFIQNSDSTGVVYLNLSGVVTATSDMVTLNQGDSILYKNITNAVSAIGSIASNATVAI